MHSSIFIDSFFKPEIVARYTPDILRAMVVTIEVAILVVVTGLALGLLLAVVRSFRLAPINLLIIAYVDVFRALPPLVLVLLVYFGLPNVGINLPSGAVLWLVLSLVLGAFAEEIFWAGILSVRKGQWEAARSTGLGFAQTLAYVILPQAIRLTVPPLTNRTIAITKNTALGSVIGVPEILNVATTTESFIGNATPLTMGALAYVALFVPVVLFGRWLETRLMDLVIGQFFNVTIMASALPLVLRGLGMTLVVCAVVIPLGLIGGLLVALAMRVRFAAVRAVVAALIDFFRAVPPLVLLIFIHAGLPFAGIRPSAFVSVCLAFLLNNSAYYGEIYRAGIESIGRGQWDAARSTGLNAVQAALYVVLPQAVRNVLPDLVSNTVEVVKLTSLASVVALPEMLYSADMARSLTYNASPIVLAAAIYLVLLWPVVRLVSRMEHRVGH